MGLTVWRRTYRAVGEKLSTVGLGTWAIRSYDKAEEVMVRAIEDYGINIIDTAEMYGYGAAERLVGRVIARVGKESVFVTTKLLPERFRDPEEAIKAARSSLDRMGIRECDLILIHWPDSVASIEKQIRSLEAIADRGLARFIGVSNFYANLLEEAITSSRKYDIVANQIHYSILNRTPEVDGTLELAASRGIMVQAYRVIERGNVKEHTSIRRVSSELGISPVELAVAYVLSSTPTTVALVKSESIAHLEEIVRGSRIVLGPRELGYIRSNI